MPRRDGTGPMGLGAMTGRGAGYCAGYGFSRPMNPVGGRGGAFGFGRGLGIGCGYGRGFGRGICRGWYYGAGAAPEQEQAALKSQLANLEQLSADIRQRLADLENAEENKK